MAYTLELAGGIMEGKDDLNLLKKAFKFLIEQYGFSVIEEKYDPKFFGNVLVHYQSSKMEIAVALDRSKLVIDFRPRRRIRKSSWFGIQSLYEFLAPNTEEPARRFLDTWRTDSLEIFFHEYFESLIRGEFVMWKDVEKARSEEAHQDYERITGKKHKSD